MSDEAFFDTNILLYVLTDDGRKAARSEELLGDGGIASVQVLNEFASVATRKYKVAWPVVRQALIAVRANLAIVPVTIEVHDRGLELVEKHRLALYDAMIVAAARLAGCKTIYSEDMHNGAAIDGLTIRNPFASE